MLKANSLLASEGYCPFASQVLYNWFVRVGFAMGLVDPDAAEQTLQMFNSSKIANGPSNNALDPLVNRTYLIQGYLLNLTD